MFFSWLIIIIAYSIEVNLSWPLIMCPIPPIMLESPSPGFLYPVKQNILHLYIGSALNSWQRDLMESLNWCIEISMKDNKFYFMQLLWLKYSASGFCFILFFSIYKRKLNSNKHEYMKMTAIAGNSYRIDKIDGTLNKAWYIATVIKCIYCW